MTPGPGNVLTRQWISRRFRRPADRRAPAGRADAPFRGDHDLNPGTRPPRSLIPAAVLVPLVDRARGLTVLLTRRTQNLADHAGQISFPGGHMEPGDDGAENAALRETEEEIGLHRRHVEILGRLDDYITRTGFRITPVVGLVEPPFDLRPDPKEVAEVFEVPLAFLLDPANRQRHSRRYDGAERHFYAIPYEDHFIWGATAGMLVALHQRLLGP